LIRPAFAEIPGGLWADVSWIGPDIKQQADTHGKGSFSAATMIFVNDKKYAW
jgi:hypothetical protein